MRMQLLQFNVLPKGIIKVDGDWCVVLSILFKLHPDVYRIE